MSVKRLELPEIDNSGYNKSLQLSAKARAQYSQGEILNMMDDDSEKLEDLSTWVKQSVFTSRYIQTIWSGPFKIIVAVVMLYKHVTHFTAFHCRSACPPSSAPLSCFSPFRSFASKPPAWLRSRSS